MSLTFCSQLLLLMCVGVQALNRKARYRGIVAGCQAQGETPCFPAAVGGLTQIAASLQQAIASHSPSQTLQNRCISLACCTLQV